MYTLRQNILNCSYINYSYSSWSLVYILSLGCCGIRLDTSSGVDRQFVRDYQNIWQQIEKIFNNK